jgi:carotenoid cleavage dioxygenase
LLVTATTFDPTRVPHLTGVFAPVSEEVDVAGLEIEGELPPGLNGLYVRNGPNPRFSPIGSYLYPIDGDGMVHGTWLAEGTARYRNRFVRTPAVDAEERAGRALWGGLMSLSTPGADEVGPDLAGTFRDMPDINVVRHGGRLLALAESARPFRLDAGLSTLGPETWDGVVPAGITAHPKIDPVTGEMFALCYGLEEPFLTWTAFAPDGSVARPPTVVPQVDAAVMVHDMALTERYVIAILAPVFFDIGAALSGGAMLDWRPDAGTRIVLLPRDGSAPTILTDEPFWVWHTANAFDEPGTGRVVIDFVEWSRFSLGPSSDGAPNTSSLSRLTLDPASGTVSRRQLLDRTVEFPRIDDRLLGRQHRVVALGDETGRRDLLSGEQDALSVVDTETGKFSFWDAGDLSVGEATFAPTDSDGDYWLTYATNRTDGSSWLLVLPADDLASGPVARVRIPVRVPLGLHGAWLPDATDCRTSC